MFDTMKDAMTDQVPDLLRRAAERAIDYRSRVDQTSPYANVTTEALRKSFNKGLPDQGRPTIDVLTDLVEAAEPGLVGSTSEAFHGWVIGGSHPAGVAADWLTSAWGQNAGMYQTSPASAVAEEIAGEWLLELLDLPRESSIGFTTGATMASFICLAAARVHVLAQAGWDVLEDGLFGAPEVQVFIGEEAHSSIFATLRYLGFGQRRLVRIAVDQEGRMRPEDLQKKMAQASGPMMIICQAGHINSGAMDAFTELARLRDEHDAWLHVDGAFGLWARSTPEYAGLCRGVDLADSWAVDGHKWLQVPYDSGYAIVRNRDAHQAAMAITASYLNQSNDGGKNPSHFVPELSRRARGFATWAVIQALGREGIARLVRVNCENAACLARELAGVGGIHILNEVSLNQVTVSFGGADETGQLQTLKIMEHIHASGKWFIREAEWKGRTVLRISFSTKPQASEKIIALADEIKSAWGRFRKLQG